MQPTKTPGIIMTVIGGALCLWVLSRINSFAGKMHSWAPPFTEYETTTLIGAAFALVLIILGLINLTKKLPEGTEQHTPSARD